MSSCYYLSLISYILFRHIFVFIHDWTGLFIIYILSISTGYANTQYLDVLLIFYFIFLRCTISYEKINTRGKEAIRGKEE